MAVEAEELESATGHRVDIHSCMAYEDMGPGVEFLAVSQHQYAYVYFTPSQARAAAHAMLDAADLVDECAARRTRQEQTRT